MNRHINVDKKLRMNSRKLNGEQHEIDNQVDGMLAYGFPDLGLNKVEDESYSEKRIKEDLKK